MSIYTPNKFLTHPSFQKSLPLYLSQQSYSSRRVSLPLTPHIQPMCRYCHLCILRPPRSLHRCCCRLIRQPENTFPLLLPRSLLRCSILSGAAPTLHLFISPYLYCFFLIIHSFLIHLMVSISALPPTPAT